MHTADYVLTRNHFLALYRRHYRIMPITNALMALAHDLLERHPLRAYDALHLASALLANVQLTNVQAPSLTFLAADNRLLQAAQAEGLPTDNPNLYP
jgi:uncharacterized protein